MFKRIKLLFIFLFFIYQSVLATSLAQNIVDTPAKYLSSRLDEIKLQVTTFDDISNNLKTNWQPYTNGDPNKVAILNSWTIENIHTTVPIRWNAQESKYELKRETLEKASSAIVRFTWYYLKVYANLSLTLRKSHSPLARGTAALVAAEVVYRENMACLPKEFTEHAAIVNILLLYEPDLLEACFKNQGRGYESVVRSAINKMCSCPQREKYEKEMGKKIVRPLHQDPSWLWKSPNDSIVANTNIPHSLQEFLPPYAASVQELLGKVKSSIKNYTIKANIIAAACPELYGIPYFADKSKRLDIDLLNSGNDWDTELDNLSSEYRKELAMRRVNKVAPNYSREQNHFAVADPEILRPLMYIATNIAANDIAVVKNLGTESLLNVLKIHNATKTVLDLAGSDPLVIMSNEAGNDDVPRITTLYWTNIVRVDEGENTRREEVTLELIDYENVGQGKPITGISTEAQVYVLEDDKEMLIEAGKVNPGMKVRGFLNVGIPGSETPLLLEDNKVREVWFEVVAVTIHKVSMAVAIGIETESGTLSELVLSYEHDVLIGLPQIKEVESNTETQKNRTSVIWRKASDIDIDNDIWVGDITGRVKYLKPLKGISRELIEFGLIWKKRGQANNLVAKAPNGNRVLVEAMPVNAGPIDPSEHIFIAGDNRIPISSVITLDSKKGNVANEVVGYYVRPEDDPWKDNPLLSQYLTFGSKKSKMDVDKAYRLTFIDGTEIKLGPYNWVLQYDGKTLTEVMVDDDLTPGIKIVSDIDNKGVIQTKELKDISKITQKHSGFILLELKNLSWIRTPTIIVSVDFRPYDIYKHGIISTADLALPATEEGIEQQISNPVKNESTSLTIPKIRMAHETLSIKDSFILKNKKLLAYDRSLDFFTDTLVGSVIKDNITRTLRVYAESADRNEQVMLECGPSQYLLCQPVLNPTHVIYESTLNLRPGDMIFIALTGQREPNKWYVQRVTPYFYPTIQVTELVTPGRQNWFQETYTEAQVAFADNIGFKLGIPRTDRIVPKKPDRPFQDGFGDAPGLHEGGRCKGETDLAKINKPVIVNRTQIRLDDPIYIPADGINQLKRRQEDLGTYYASEKHLTNKNKTNERFIQFWKQMMTTISPEEIRKLLDENKDISGHERYKLNEIYNFLKQHIEKGTYTSPEYIWPINAMNTSAMDDWMDALLRVRNDFLNKNKNASWLQDLLTMELISASWLESFGAKRTADLLILDMLELALYAGCEVGCERKRLGDNGLNLEILLFSGDWIKGIERQSLDTDMKIGVYAQEYIKNWMLSHGFEPRVAGENSIYLSIVYAYWIMAGEHSSLDPLWRSGLTPLSKVENWQKTSSELDNLFYSVIRNNIVRLQTRPCMVGEPPRKTPKDQRKDTSVVEVDLNR